MTIILDTITDNKLTYSVYKKVRLESASKNVVPFFI